mmetsp:Transcript_89351/g.288925  ORF Transcript_89351/g.288925 Transcript_89351/m.288925 type:complete len:218 (+) Transcript_89351:320-973(+)
MTSAHRAVACPNGEGEMSRGSREGGGGDAGSGAARKCCRSTSSSACTRHAPSNHKASESTTLPSMSSGDTTLSPSRRRAHSSALVSSSGALAAVAPGAATRAEPCAEGTMASDSAGHRPPTFGSEAPSAPPAAGLSIRRSATSKGTWFSCSIIRSSSIDGHITAQGPSRVGCCCEVEPGRDDTQGPEPSPKTETVNLSVTIEKVGTTPCRSSTSRLR